MRDEALGARVALLAYVVWWFLLGDIILHLITGRRVEGTDDLKPLCHAYLKSYWWHIDTGLLMPGLVETVVTFVVKKVGLDHPIVFIYHRIHIIPPHRRFRPGRYIRKLIVFLVKFSLRHRRLVRGLVAEIETLAGVAEAAQMVLRETQEVAEVYEQARDFTPKGSLRLKNFTPGTGERRGSFSFDGQQALRQTNRGKAVRAEGARS